MIFPTVRPACVLLGFALLSVASLPASPAATPPKVWGAEGFQPLTEARIAALPEAERPVWIAYWKESQQRLQRMPERSTAEPIKATGHSTYSKGVPLKNADGWFASAEAQASADQVAVQQAPTGGWTKGNDYSPAATPVAPTRDTWTGGTFDNNATVPEIRFLAKVLAAAPKSVPEARRQAWSDSLARGLDYVFAAQYPNGGFPQIYPLVGGYHDAVTLNDDAMVHVLELLRDVAAGAGEFAALPEARRKEAHSRFERGVACLLAAQIHEPDGTRTAWCQQHDPITLLPCAARNFEPIAVCTSESASAVKFLIELRSRTAAIDRAIEDAVSWFEKVALHDAVRDKQSTTQALAPTPGAPLLWSRLYEVGTDRPIFGDRDHTVHYELTELSRERQKGYAWFGSWPNTAIEKWRKAAKKSAKAKP